ncbi:MAG: hypothetical protein DLM58_17770 [Pseudonocardiales bacterium]|nr:MAG: hypothetical protein DLM58_17770 [Pseudonocardiales bacterium]
MSTALAPPVQASAQPDPVRAPEFTLGTALAWLGHHCADRCSVALDTLGATIWFIQQPTSPWLLPDDTLIVLDLAPSVMSAVQIRRLLRQINACARADGLRVCALSGDDPQVPWLRSPATLTRPSSAMSWSPSRPLSTATLHTAPLP